MKSTRPSEWSSGPAPSRPRRADSVGVAAEKRIHIRFDMLFSCVVASELYGEVTVVVRNVSAGGMLVQAPEVLPLGAVVTVALIATIVLGVFPGLVSDLAEGASDALVLGR